MPLDRRQFLVAAAAGIAGCTATAGDGRTGGLNHSIEQWPGYRPEWDPPPGPPATDVRTERLVENLEIPWDLAFAPTGDLFITERTGRVLRLEQGEVETVTEPEAAIDAAAVEPGSDDGGWFIEGGEGGVLGIAVHPSYPDRPFVYIYYTRRTDGGEKRNRVSRFDVAAEDPATTERPIVEGIPADAVHNGGRIAFGPENYLWITIGDAGRAERAQDGDSLAGKVLRVDARGEAPPANPAVDGRDPRVFTLGHRNPQGLSWLPDGTPIVTEHGPDGHDEVTLLEPGADCGWPTARTPEEYAGTDYHRPLVNTPEDGPSWAPAGGTVYTGDRLPSWRNRFVFGTLFGQRIRVVTLTPPGAPIDGGDGRHDDDWLDGTYDATVHRALSGVLGRVRHVEQGPDNHLYAITSNRDGRARGEFPRQVDDVLVRIRSEAE